MRSSEVAVLFAVDPKTVLRWAQSGKIRSLKTPGGHHRFYADEILLLARFLGSDDDDCVEEELCR